MGGYRTPNFYRVGTDETSQKIGTENARFHARLRCRQDGSRNYEFEFIRERARRGVNMVFGAKE